MNMVTWKYSDAHTICDCREQRQTMEHLLKCPMLPQKCTNEDLMEYNEAANECVCLPVDEQCVVTRQEEEPTIPRRNLVFDLLCCCIVQILEGSMIVLHLL